MAKKNNMEALEVFFRSEVTEEHGFAELWPLLSPAEQEFYENANLDELRAETVDKKWTTD